MYMKKWAVESGVAQEVKLGHRVKEARWREEEGVWELEGTREDGTVFRDRGEVLASCHGALK